VRSERRPRLKSIVDWLSEGSGGVGREFDVDNVEFFDVVEG
jgi:hypothetical protein